MTYIPDPFPNTEDPHYDACQEILLGDYHATSHRFASDGWAYVAAYVPPHRPGEKVGNIGYTIRRTVL